MFIASILACCKIATLLINHKGIKILVRKLVKEPCKPEDDHESTIQNKFDESIGSMTIYYTILVEITVVCMILSSVFTDFKDRKLLYSAWIPFDYSTSNLYYIVYLHQVVALIGTSLLNVACDVIVCGLLVHACSQQEILKYRLKGMIEKSNANMGKIVRFHDYLYGYAAMVQEKFKIIIGVQLVSSTLVVCFIMYKLTNTPMSSKYLQFVLYMACMMSQIFFYCWYGNELKLKSVEMVDAISEMDWILLDKNNKKNLINIIRRALNPIELSSAYMYTMDLDTFVSILKMSYSAYNLLQRTKESFVFTLINTSMILQIMDLVLIVENQDELSENIFLMLTMLVACHKMYSMLMSRKNIAVFNDILENEPFQPENVEEIEIRGRFNRRAEIQAYIYTVVNEMAVIFHSYSGLLKSEKLPYRMWLPYKHLSLTMLIFTYILQALSLMIGSLVHIACDNLIWGMLIHTCSQIEILGYRLKAIKPSEIVSLKIESSAMQLLQRIFQLLAVCGCWQPPSSTPPYKKFLYTVYTVILFILLNAITLLQCLDLILVVESQEEFSDNIYLTLTMLVSCHKMYSMLPSQKNITVLINILEKKPFQPENEKEMEIRKRFDKRAQATVHIACDALIWGLFIHTCSQLEILGARLKAIKQGNNQSAKASARYHDRVYRFTRMINDEFKMIIFVQFTVSTLVVCFTLYILVITNDMNTKFVNLIMYACAMLVQIFFFCWYGNEVKLKSIGISDVIFGIDWTQMNNDTKRILLMIMRRATDSIEFTSFHIVTLNLESFVNLLKTSYSAFNVLQSGQG
ncbi:uncharacterized protein LOC114872760 [Osmia bicornis bicornis]|uniref:uncharacterized protein LOC114872760 n=1 Tax=Osmia bicornis bicornis TaxID=1437191 RepID=UPI001EAF7185|nr:uncharacterized protein LOC114872760 [Osmia bicornis bicornis]